jgi:hypothetical protein
MASINIAGDTSGTITLSAPLVAGSNTVTLPAATGTISLLTQGTAVASTSGTSIDFTGIPSWAKRITVMFSGVSTNSTSPPQIQIGAGSVITSGYLGSNSIVASAGVSTVSFTSGFGIGLNTSNWLAANILHGSIVLSLVSGNTWVASGCTSISNAANSFLTSGSIALGGTLDRVRITTVNGTDTFDAGSINVMWEG